MLVVSFINQSPTFLISFLSFFFPFLLSPFLYVCSFFHLYQSHPSSLCLLVFSLPMLCFLLLRSISLCSFFVCLPPPLISPSFLYSFFLFLYLSLTVFSIHLFFLLLSLSLDLFLLSQFLSSLPLNQLSPGGWSHINQVAGSREWWQ